MVNPPPTNNGESSDDNTSAATSGGEYLRKMICINCHKDVPMPWSANLSSSVKVRLNIISFPYTFILFSPKYNILFVDVNMLGGMETVVVLVICFGYIYCLLSFLSKHGHRTFFMAKIGFQGFY